MPFKSEAQRRYFHVMQAQGKISPETVKEWEDATSPKAKKRLPYHVGEVPKTAAVRGKLVAKAPASAREYSLRENAEGKMSCTCGDYKFRQGAVGGECKHIKAHRSSRARTDGVPMIRDHVKAGSEAALAKYAIEFKSPKMQSILTNAVDQAYTSGRSGRLYNKRFGFGDTRPAAKMISAAYLDGRKGPILPARHTYGESMPLGEELRRLTFGGNRPGSGAYTSRSVPHPGLDGATRLGNSRIRDALQELRFSEQTPVGMVPESARFDDPRIQRVIEHHAPGGIAHIKERMRRLNAGEPMPAFNAQKLKPPGETP